MAYNFNDTSKKKIDVLLKSFKNDLYDIPTELEIRDVMFGPCQCYIIRFNYQGMVFYNGYRNFDLMHVCVKNDGSGLIDYIKIYPEKNQKANVLMNIVRLTGSLFGMKIGKIDEGSDFDDRFIRLYVSE